MAMDLVLSFPDEHSRILRALHDSLDRESDAQRLLRRMKESLVATALKLQVAVKTVEDDEVTIQQLRKELEEMRRDAKNAGKSAADATKVIGDLRIEVAGLKRRLNHLEQSQQQQEALEKSASNLKSGSGVNNNRPKSKKGNNNSKENSKFNDFTRPPPGHICDDQVNSMFRDARNKDGGFAIDARSYLEDLHDIQNNDNIENSLYLQTAESVESALIELRNMEKNIGMDIGTGSGLGNHASPMGLQGHPRELKAIKNKNVINDDDGNNNSSSSGGTMSGADTEDMMNALFNATSTMARSIHGNHTNAANTTKATTIINEGNITTNTSLPSLTEQSESYTTANYPNSTTATVNITNKTNLYSENGGSVLNATPTYDESINQSSNYGGATQGDITSFQQWKMSNFLWAPDTPEASKGADHWAVERLTDSSLRSALQEVGDKIRRPVLGNVTKVNDISLSRARAPPKVVLGPLGLPVWPPKHLNNNASPILKSKTSKSPIKKNNNAALPTMTDSVSSRVLKSRGNSRNAIKTHANTTTNDDKITSGSSSSSHTGHRMTVAEIKEELEGSKKKVTAPSEPEETIVV